MQNHNTIIYFPTYKIALGKTDLNSLGIFIKKNIFVTHYFKYKISR